MWSPETLTVLNEKFEEKLRREDDGEEFEDGSPIRADRVADSRGKARP